MNNEMKEFEKQIGTEIRIESSPAAAGAGHAEARGDSESADSSKSESEQELTLHAEIKELRRWVLAGRRQSQEQADVTRSIQSLAEHSQAMRTAAMHENKDLETKHNCLLEENRELERELYDLQARYQYLVDSKGGDGDDAPEEEESGYFETDSDDYAEEAEEEDDEHMPTLVADDQFVDKQKPKKKVAVKTNEDRGNSGEPHNNALDALVHHLE